MDFGSQVSPPPSPPAASFVSPAPSAAALDPPAAPRCPRRVCAALPSALDRAPALGGVHKRTGKCFYHLPRSRKLPGPFQQYLVRDAIANSLCGYFPPEIVAMVQEQYEKQNENIKCLRCEEIMRKEDFPHCSEDNCGRYGPYCNECEREMHKTIFSNRSGIREPMGVRNRDGNRLHSVGGFCKHCHYWFCDRCSKCRTVRYTLPGRTPALVTRICLVCDKLEKKCDYCGGTWCLYECMSSEKCSRAVCGLCYRKRDPVCRQHQQAYYRSGKGYCTEHITAENQGDLMCYLSFIRYYKHHDNLGISRSGFFRDRRYITTHVPCSRADVLGSIGEEYVQGGEGEGDDDWFFDEGGGR